MALNVFFYVDVLRLRELASVEFGRRYKCCVRALNPPGRNLGRNFDGRFVSISLKLDPLQSF
jgi:hypothetical protein